MPLYGDMFIVFSSQIKVLKRVSRGLYLFCAVALIIFLSPLYAGNKKSAYQLRYAPIRFLPYAIIGLLIFSL